MLGTDVRRDARSGDGDAQFEFREDIARDYVENYLSRAERMPRLLRLPDRRLVHITTHLH